MIRQDDEPTRQGLKLTAHMTLEEIAACMNCTRERVRQIETKALRKLKHQMRKRGLRLEDFVNYNE